MAQPNMLLCFMNIGSPRLWKLLLFNWVFTFSGLFIDGKEGDSSTAECLFVLTMTLSLGLS